MRDSWDVIVCGGGTAGAVAGIAAAREGARTLIVERQGALGGTQTMGWVTPMMPNELDGRPLCAGLDAEIRRRHGERHPGEAQAWFNPLTLAIILEEMAEEHGTSLLLETQVIAVERTDGWEIEVVCRSQIRRLRAKALIDCTGDADVAVLAGAETMCGDETGAHQPATLRFTVGNVDFEKVCADLQSLGVRCSLLLLQAGFKEARDSPIGPRVAQAVADGALEEDDLGYFQFFAMLGRPRELAFNCPRLSGVDGSDPEDVTRARVLGRRKIARIAEFLRRYMPGFEDAYVAVLAPMLGVRETRRVVGEHVLTEEECLAATKFPDPVARCNYPVDVHNPTGPGVLWKPIGRDYYEIPYRCLTPRGVDGLLVAGRCLSATFHAQASARIQPVCRAMGETAGIAAALCARECVEPRALPYPALRERLDHWGLLPAL